MLPKWKEGHRGTFPLIHCLVEAGQRIQPRIWWRRYYHRWAHLPRQPLDSHNLADCHPYAPYHTRVDGHAQLPKITGCVIASTSEWLLGRGEETNPHLPMHEVDHYITDLLQEACPGDRIVKAVVLAPDKAILFFGRCSCREGFPYRNAKDVELSLKGLVNLVRRTAQVEVTTNTVQEGCWAMVDAIIMKKT